MKHILKDANKNFSGGAAGLMLKLEEPLLHPRLEEKEPALCPRCKGDNKDLIKPKAGGAEDQSGLLKTNCKDEDDDVAPQFEEEISRL